MHNIITEILNELSIREINDIPCDHLDEDLMVDEIKKMNTKLIKLGDTSQVTNPWETWIFYQKMLSALFRASSGLGIGEFNPDCNQLSYYLCHYIQDSENDKAQETFEFVKETFDCMEFAYLSTLD